MEITREELETKLLPLYPGGRLILGSGTLTAPVSGFIVSDAFEGKIDLYRHQEVRRRLKEVLGDKADAIGILEPHTEAEIEKMEEEYEGQP